MVPGCIGCNDTLTGYIEICNDCYQLLKLKLLTVSYYPFGGIIPPDFCDNGHNLIIYKYYDYATYPGCRFIPVCPGCGEFLCGGGTEVVCCDCKMLLQKRL